MKICLDCGKVKSSKGLYCKMHGYRHRNRPKGLIYIKHKENPTSFKEGHKTWNKGLIGLQIAWNKGLKGTHFSLETEFKKGQFINEKNPKWKGDKVGYYALHLWIYRKFGKPIKCEICHGIKNLEWSNKSGKYLRYRNDWQRLCRKCHRNYDSQNIWGMATQKYPELKRINL